MKTAALMLAIVCAAFGVTAAILKRADLTYGDRCAAAGGELVTLHRPITEPRDPANTRAVCAKIEILQPKEKS